MVARKRKLAESLVAGELCETNLKTKFEEICTQVTSGDELDRKTLKTLKTFLLDAKDSSAVDMVPKLVDFKLLTSLLSHYTATQSKNNRLILDILFTLERSFSINLQALKPLAFGPTSKDNYENLFKYGHALFSRMKPDNVLDLFDAKDMWFSIMNLDDSLVAVERIQNNRDRVYDPEFVLRLLFTLLETGSEISSYKFVGCNGLGFVFACLSLHNDKIRALAYFTLQRFLAHLNALTNEVFPERALILYLVRTFKNSVTKQNQRLSHIISHFFARVSKLLLNAEDPVYGPIMAFLTMKPTIDLENVPEMYKLLLSSSTLHNRRERQWILKLIAASLIEPHDYHILEKRYGMKLCLSLYGSCISDPISRDIIVNLLESCVQLPSVARDLYNRLNLHTWIALMIQKTYLKNQEIMSLYRLFYSFLDNIRQICLEDIQPGSPLNISVAMKERMAKVVGKHVIRQLSQHNEKDETGDKALLTKLEVLVETPWQIEEDPKSESSEKDDGTLLRRKRRAGEEENGDGTKERKKKRENK